MDTAQARVSAAAQGMRRLMVPAISESGGRGCQGGLMPPRD